MSVDKLKENINIINETIAELNEQVNTLKKELQEVQTEKAKVDSECSSVYSCLDEKSKRLADIESSIAEKELAIEENAELTKQAQAAVEALKLKCEQYTFDRDSKVMSFKELKVKNNVAMTKCCTLYSSLALIEEKASIMDNKIDEQNKDYANIQKDLNDLERVHKQAQEKLASKTKFISTMRSDIDQMEKQLVQLTESSNKLDMDLNNSYLKHNTLMDEYAECKEKNDLMREELATFSLTEIY